MTLATEALRKREARARAKPTQQRAVSDRAWVKAQLAAVEAKSPKRSGAESVAAFLARGGKAEVLPGFTHQPDFRRRAIQHRRVQGES